MLVMPSPPIIMADQEQLIVSPVSISASSTASASLAATLTPGTPTALDEQKHVISLSDTIKHLSTSPSISTSTSTGLGIPATAGGPPSTSSETSSSSLDDDYYYEDGDEGVDDDMDYAYNEDDYGTELRHQRAKRAARILLAQCLLEDNPRYYSEDSFSRSGRLGLAPVTLLLNPVSKAVRVPLLAFTHFRAFREKQGSRAGMKRGQAKSEVKNKADDIESIVLFHIKETPCPTKIIPLPTSTLNDSDNSSSSYASSSSSSSSYSSSISLLDDTDEDDQEKQDIEEAQQASLFIRLL